VLDRLLGRVLLSLVIGVVARTADPLPIAAQRTPTPIRQTTQAAALGRGPIGLAEASRNDRWLGLGVREIRWAPDGETVYFRWNLSPKSDDLPEADPWFRAAAGGEWVERVPDDQVELVPGAAVVWDGASRRAAWATGTSLYVFDPASAPSTRRVVTLTASLSDPIFARGDSALDFSAGETLYRYWLADGALSVVATRVTVDPAHPTEAGRQLALEQRVLFPRIRDADRVRLERARLARSEPDRPQPIPLPSGTSVGQLRASPDGRFVTFRAVTRDPSRPPTKYVDYLDESGYSRVHDARAKAGEPRDRTRLGVVAIDPGVPADSVAVRWVELREAGHQPTVSHGPYWSPDGRRAVAQFAGVDGKDLWIAEIDVASASARVLAHDHDDGWIGGPPIQSNYRGPTLLEWLPGGELVFASERSGWSHLYLVAGDGSTRPLTEGQWEVRSAALSRDRTGWLLSTSREHPADDNLERLPAAGGSHRQLTRGVGRSNGVLSPDGSRVAILYSTTSALPDLYLADAAGESRRRITVSGSAELLDRLVDPEIVSFPHPDGRPVWAALYRPKRMNRERAAVIHVHGGGYRQFAHRGWSVYGWGLHVGFLHALLEAGYPVLDFDYRGGAGFGKAYRTDVAGAMGGKDVDGAVAAARYLVQRVGADSTRIGIYGVSYGGFMTLMTQFRYPGIFAAGISRAPVTDWAHYSDEWTSRILGVPQEDTAAYRRSSPIYFADGLADHLLIEHGLVDDNVHFQDTARLVERLIELGKDFEVMYYPSEPHTVETEPSRLDQSKRAMRFFDRFLRGPGPPDRR